MFNAKKEINVLRERVDNGTDALQSFIEKQDTVESNNIDKFNAVSDYFQLKWVWHYPVSNQFSLEKKE